MTIFGDDIITNFFRPISSKGKHKEGTQLRKRKRAQVDLDTNLTSSGKKPKVQQKLVFLNERQSKAGPSKQETTRSSLAKSSKSKNDHSSNCVIQSSFSASPPVEVLPRVLPTGEPSTRRLNSFPTPGTADRPIPVNTTRPFLVLPETDRTTTPGPSSPLSTEPLLLQNRTHLPTPVTMPRHTFYHTRVQDSPPSRGRSLSPPKEHSSPEISQSPSIYPASSEYEESMRIHEGQGDYDNHYPSPSPISSQQFVPSSQSQADGTFDHRSVDGHAELLTPPCSSLFLVPPLPNNTLTTIPCLERGNHDLETSQIRDPNDAETSRIEIDGGHEYVLSSQSQLVLPFHVSPRKNRTKLPYPSSPSLSENAALSDEIIPSSQSHIEKELDASSLLSADKPPSTKANSRTSELTVKHLEWHTSSSFSSVAGESTRTSVDETMDGYTHSPKDDEQGSATEEESGDEEDPFNLLVAGAQPEHEPLIPRSASFTITQAPLSQESMGFPSSLPDVVKEFRDMFGAGEGSYPDDFPESLR